MASRNTDSILAIRSCSPLIMAITSTMANFSSLLQLYRVDCKKRTDFTNKKPSQKQCQNSFQIPCTVISKDTTSQLMKGLSFHLLFHTPLHLVDILDSGGCQWDAAISTSTGTYQNYFINQVQKQQLFTAGLHHIFSS